MKLQNTINRCPIISKEPTVNIAGTAPVPAFTPTPCPGTGTHHVWDSHYHEHLDGDWIEVTCPECEWVALGLLFPNSNDRLEFLVPDDMYDENPKGVSMWRETIRSHNPFPHLVSSSGKIIGPSLLPTPIVNYHTHSKEPVIVGNEEHWLI